MPEHCPRSDNHRGKLKSKVDFLYCYRVCNWFFSVQCSAITRTWDRTRSYTNIVSIVAHGPKAYCLSSMQNEIWKMKSAKLYTVGHLRNNGTLA